jgi:uncharacterized protein YdaU (DUF1376 family)
MPYFGDAYMADTRHLSLEEHGAYHLLLLIAWRSPNCALPDDDKRIAQMLGITAKKWATLKPTVMAFWTRTKHGFEQKRLSKERRWVDEKSRKNRDAAKASHKARSIDHLSTFSFPAGAKSSDHNQNPPEDDCEANPLENNDQASANAQPNATANAHANGGAPPPPPLKKKITSPKGDSSLGPNDPPLTEQEVLEAWTERMVPQGFPAVRKMTDTRRRQLRARLRDSTIEEWQQAMDAMERSAFLRGENDRGWRADFDFLLQPKSFTKLLEGAYDH